MQGKDLILLTHVGGTIKKLKKRVSDCLSKKKSNYQKSGKQHGIFNLDKKVAPDVICAVADDMILLASNSLA